MTNPLEHSTLRGCDELGCGSFGASRGTRKHKGVDYKAKEGASVYSPIEGIITKHGYPYRDDLSYRYIQVENEVYKIRLFYCELRWSFEVGDEVCEGDFIGIVQDIASRYIDKGIMNNHVHVEIYENNNLVDPTTIL